MFMFQNGLFATFIPELLMVIGYLLCLLTPGVKPQRTDVELIPVVAHISSSDSQHISTYQLTISDFRIVADFVPDSAHLLSHFVEKTLTIYYKSTFSTSDGLSYVDFSRPPPAFVS